MADIVLEGDVRTEFGKGAARRLRVAQLIPATIYAGGEQPAFKFGGESKHAVVKDVQRNPVKRIVEHIDFYEVKAGEKLVVEVPVFVEGTPKGSAVPFLGVQTLSIRADVTALPERVNVSIDGLMGGSKVYAKDIVLPEGAELAQTDPNETVVTLNAPSGSADAEEEVAADASEEK